MLELFRKLLANAGFLALFLAFLCALSLVQNLGAQQTGGHGRFA